MPHCRDRKPTIREYNLVSSAGCFSQEWLSLGPCRFQNLVVYVLEKFDTNGPVPRFVEMKGIDKCRRATG